MTFEKVGNPSPSAVSSYCLLRHLKIITKNCRLEVPIAQVPRRLVTNSKEALREGVSSFVRQFKRF